MWDPYTKPLEGPAVGNVEMKRTKTCSMEIAKLKERNVTLRPRVPRLETTLLPHSEIWLWCSQKAQPSGCHADPPFWRQGSDCIRLLTQTASLGGCHYLYILWYLVKTSFDFFSTNILSSSLHCQLCWELRCLGFIPLDQDFSTSSTLSPLIFQVILLFIGEGCLVNCSMFNSFPWPPVSITRTSYPPLPICGLWQLKVSSLV